MTAVRLKASDLKRCVERKAYAYGVSSVVSTLLGEYVVELIKETYAKHTEKQLVPDTSGQS